MTTPRSGLPVTRIARPRPISTRPPSRRSRSARRTVLLLTPSTVARSRACGMRSPGPASPSLMARRISAATCSCRGVGSSRSTASSASPAPSSSSGGLTSVMRLTRIASMAAFHKLPLRRRVRRWLRSLFHEARQLERRRRRRYAAGVVLVCGIAAGGGFLISENGVSSAGPGDHPVPPLVSSLALPKAGGYFSLAVVGGHVIVSGGPEGSLFPSGSTTSLSNDRAVGTCDAAAVEPGTLKLGHVAHANCGDPTLYGEQVLAVSYLAQPPASRPDELDTFAVRIAHVDPAARDGYPLGPIVMTYPQCSDCDAQWVYGDGSLWLYDTYNNG